MVSAGSAANAARGSIARRSLIMGSRHMINGKQTDLLAFFLGFEEHKKRVRRC
jgi:hypothetical protein